jgi:uncharacterized protein YprB with RNaseH-like and TPR domain
MTIEASAPSTDLARRLERFRAARAETLRPDGPLPHRPIGSAELADRLASTLDGEVVGRAGGRFVRVERPAVAIPVDRARLASLPGQPPADRPLVCLDTETTGLATATGTVAFCIGLGWWEGPSFRQVQLLLPDHADEPVLLAELARHIPADAWLVTYNGRGFDWPLLVTRFRMASRAAPVHDGHLDLLPIVRRVFRHRMTDARLKTAEETLLGMVRHDDVDGWEIPARYLGFLRGGPAHPLLAVVRHNDEDVRSLARLIALLDQAYATPEARRTAPSGDLAGLARAFVRARRLDEALGCLDEVVDRGEEGSPTPAAQAAPAVVPARAPEPVPWWSPRAVPDFGGRPRSPTSRVGSWAARQAFANPWDQVRIAVDRAHLLRRLGRYDESVAAWTALAAGPGRTAVVARIEIAKLREHRLADRSGALAAAVDGLAVADRRRRLGLPEPALEADLARRIARLRARRAVNRASSPP